VRGAFSDRLGKQILSDENLLQHMSLLDLLRHRRGTGNLTTLAQIRHPARHLVTRLGKSGFPVTLTTPPWTLQQRDSAIQRGPHLSSHTHEPDAVKSVGNVNFDELDG
jgi:hypothetical protein